MSDPVEILKAAREGASLFKGYRLKRLMVTLAAVTVLWSRADGTAASDRWYSLGLWTLGAMIVVAYLFAQGWSDSAERRALGEAAKNAK